MKLEIQKNQDSILKNKDVTMSLSMTVCIGALAENGDKAILVADKMLTATGVFPYQSDNGAEKILKINENMHVMWCGGLNDAVNILKKVKTEINGKSLTVQETAEVIRLQYWDYLMKDVFEKEVLQGRAIPNFESFYGDATINLTKETRQEIEKLIPLYNLASNTSFILCGKDIDNKYKIYTIGTNPRFNIILASEGWATVGSGATHAQFGIIHSNYNVKLGISTVERILKSAKKKAEKEPSVGKETDFIVLI